MLNVKPQLLDVYCGVGGASRGYQDAGFEVTGVDIKAQPRYIGEGWFQGDAIDFIEKHGRRFDFIHASPPCQAHCLLTKGTHKGRANDHVNLIPQTREALEATGKPYVIENVVSAPLRKDLVLCGEMFGLDVIRHRNFEMGGWSCSQPKHIKHRGRVAGYRHGQWYEGPYFAVYGNGGGKGTVDQWRKTMAIDWTWDRRELAEAIPPAYTEYIGTQFLKGLAA